MSDPRLLAPAGAAWLGALFIGSMPADLPARLGLLLLGAVTLMALLVRRFGRSVILAGLCLVAGGLAAAGQATALGAQPLAGWAVDGATATVTAVVVGEPMSRRWANSAPWQAESVVELRVATSRIAARDGVVAVQVPVLVRLDPNLVAPPPGSLIEFRGRLGVARPGSAVAATLRVLVPPVVIDPPGPVDRAANAMRQGLVTAVGTRDIDAGALVAGLAVGDESLQTAALDEAMRSSGLSHLTAVSGGNVAIVVATVVALTTVCRLPLVVRVLTALAALGFFVVLVGHQPSVLRASVMGAVVLVALLIGGRRPGPSVLATAVLMLVLVSPDLARSWAFVLSVVATGALILLAPPLAAWLRDNRLTARWPPVVQVALAVTLAAQLATLPVLLMMGASVGWVAVPANLLAMPVVPAVTVLGLAAAVVSPVLPGVALGLAVVAAWPAGWIAGVAHVASGLPGAQLPLPPGPMGVAAVIVLAAALVGLRRWRGRQGPLPRGLVAAACVLPALVGGLWLVAPPGGRSWPPTGWLLVACDVGQGSALVVRAGEGAGVLVDAGPDPDVVDRCLADAGITRLPVVLITHFHADHVDGLPGALAGRAVGQVLTSPVREPVDRAQAVDDVLRAVGLEAVVVSAGDARRVGEVEWRTLWPRRVIDAGSVPNNASLVLAVTVRGFEVLLTGDIEAEAQTAVAANLAGRAFDVVTVPHHGSPNQADLALGVSTSLALVSVGSGNPYGHPDADTLQAWSEAGALVARTDQDGDIAVVEMPGGRVAAVTRR